MPRLVRGIWPPALDAPHEAGHDVWGGRVVRRQRLGVKAAAETLQLNDYLIKRTFKQGILYLRPPGDRQACSGRE
jgi:hypothetical protein